MHQVGNQYMGKISSGWSVCIYTKICGVVL